MRRWSIPMMALALCIASSWGSFALADAGKSAIDLSDIPHFARSGSGTLLHSTHTGEVANFAKAGPDTVYLYGGPGTLQGKFQTIDGGSGGVGDAMGWTGFDRTETQTYWNISTFNAANFTGSAGNHAIWSGVPAGTIGYQNAPGYGNGWDDRLVFARAADPGVAHSVQLSFEYHYETEPGYDFFTVEYDSAGAWKNLLAVSGTNDDGSGAFATPAIFDQNISLPAGSLGGNSSNEVRLRIRFQSDGAASDEDAFFDSIAGACQVDNIVVRLDGALISTADFEGSAGDSDWQIVQAPLAGDFAKIFPVFLDTDPCRSNTTPQFGFLDDGTPPSNGGGESTGGQISVNWSYGVAGGWVTNYTGGLSFGELTLWNEFHSPVIPWDLPGTADDGVEGAAFFRISLWEHLPLENGMFWIWQVRSQDQNGDWSPWSSRNLVTFEDLAVYSNARTEVGDLLVSNPQAVQLALGVIDLAAIFQLPGGDSTPAPLYDNVAFARYRVAGPSITVRNFDLFQDSFPNGGSIDISGDLSALSVRLDAAQDIVRGSGLSNIAGDSIVATIQPAVPGTELLAAPKLKWVLDANPLFDGVRTIPAGANNVGSFTGLDGRSWNRWRGEVDGEVSVTAAGTEVDGNWFFDLPDGPANPSAAFQVDDDAMFYPGDQIRYYIEATDDLGNVSTLPADLTGFESGNWTLLGRTFTINALPTLLDADANLVADQPSVLIVNDFGRRGGENDFLSAFAQNGLVERRDYDVYNLQGPDSQVSNGIGSAGVHGANADQLSSYSTIFYFSGDLTTSLSDGVAAGDKSDDLAVLTNWHELAGDRHIVYFGDYVVSATASLGAAGLTYVTSVMGVEPFDVNVSDEVGGQTAPVVVPTGALPLTFGQRFVAFGGCLGINEFDSIRPGSNSVASHEFLDPNGASGAYAPAAAVWYERSQTVAEVSYRRVDVTFPFGFVFLWNETVNKAPDGASARSFLIHELLTEFGSPTNDGGATAVDTPRRKTALFDNVPNPFNPSTEISFRIGVAGEYSLRVYNLRGELVRTLVNGPLEVGDQSAVWNGRDESGRTVSSGVYLYRLKGGDFVETKKMTILK